MELTAEQLELKQKMVEAKEKAWQARVVLDELHEKCEKSGHAVRVKTKPDHVDPPRGHFGGWEDWGTAVCEVCGDRVGWYCTVNPNHYCEYNNGDEDYCDHCGEPEERK